MVLPERSKTSQQGKRKKYGICTDVLAFVQRKI